MGTWVDVNATYAVEWIEIGGWEKMQPPLARRDLADGVTVLIPTYEHEKYLSSCIDSILCQEIEVPVYIYIFVDKSEKSEQTLRIAEQYQSKYPKIVEVFKNPERLGSGTASFMYHRPKVNTKYWCILEGDDCWLSQDRLRVMVNELEKAKNAVGVCTRFMVERVNGEVVGPEGPDYRRYNLLGKTLFSSKVISYAHTSSILWKNLYRYRNMPLPRKYYRLLGDPGLEMAMLGSSREMICLDKIGSLYRLTGRGRWSCLSKEEMDRENILAEARWKRARPLRISLSLFLLDMGRTINYFLLLYRLLSRSRILPLVVAESDSLLDSM